MPQAYWGAYSVVRAGLKNLVEIYVVKNHKTKLQINFLDPGLMATKIKKDAMPGLNTELWPKPEAVVDMFVKTVK